jgi:HNH endonuclease
MSNSQKGKIISESIKEKIRITNLRNHDSQIDHIHPKSYGYEVVSRQLSTHGYVIIATIPKYPLSDSNGHIYEHRFIFQESNRVCLLPWYDIHHINGVKTDNRIENLQPLMRSEHTRLTNPRKIDMSDRKCFECKSNESRIVKRTKGILSQLWYKHKDITGQFLCNSCYERIYRKWGKVKLTCLQMQK